MSKKNFSKKWQAVCGVTLASLALSLGGTSALADDITVQVDEPTISISPKLYGIFFEEVNMAGDGGLYAELIRNRNFEESADLDFWETKSWGAATATSAISNDVPTGGFNKQSAVLRVTMAEGAKGCGTLSNTGYFGVSVKACHSYILNLYVKGTAKSISAMLMDEDGTCLGAKEKVKVTGEWVHHSLILSPSKTSHHARLVLALSESAEVKVDMVSLFPAETWKNHGLRMDLAEKLVALKPAFVRFPGGCWVEGNTMATSYRWKQTIGKESERRTQQDLWGYMVGNGLGYHEYLQMCEDLDAQALFVINCGMSHHGVVPMDQMGEYVQDALDAIEYAIGSVSTRWGAERSMNGHPEPFPLTMIQIGNENGGPQYYERYALFYDAIKAQYPEINVVVCLWNGKPTNRPIDLLDEHYYNTPDFFYKNFHKYDTYDRNNERIYVGEYAVTQQTGQGALRGALGEAVFMMGMENNADVVAMSSYAPLFVNVNHRTWNPNLINFNNHQSYGTPSYYVQELFAQNIGERVVPVDTTVKPLIKDKTIVGGIGLGTWLTQAEFKDLKVTVDGKVVYEGDGSDFAKWKRHGGDWKVTDGVIQQGSLDENVYAYLPAQFRDYTFTVKARKTGGKEGFLVMCNVGDDKNYLWWNLGGWGNNRHALEMVIGGGKGEYGKTFYGKIDSDKWYDIQMDVKDKKIVCYLDGQKIHEESFIVESPSVFASASRTDDELFVRAVNLAGEARALTLHLETAGQIAPKGTVIELSHPDEWAENSLSEPERIAPVEKKIKVAKTMDYVLPANSVNIFKFTLKK